VADWLRDAAEGSSIALVGHLPFLDRLASLLITTTRTPTSSSSAWVVSSSSCRSRRPRVRTRLGYGRQRSRSRPRLLVGILSDHALHSESPLARAPSSYGCAHVPNVCSATFGPEITGSPTTNNPTPAPTATTPRWSAGHSMLASPRRCACARGQHSGLGRPDHIRYRGLPDAYLRLLTLSGASEAHRPARKCQPLAPARASCGV
jgi:hypothetical protein